MQFLEQPPSYPGPPLLPGVASAFGGHYRGGPFEVGGGLLGGGLVVGPATPLALLGVTEPLPRRGGTVSPCCHLRKYVVLCLGVGALSSLIGSLFLLVHLLLRARTSSLHYFETVPGYVPASVLILTGLVVACFARRKNRYGYLMKVSGGCWLGCAALCVAVTVTTTVLHMNRLQTLRECVYTQRLRTCVCYSHPHIRHPGPPLPPPPTSTSYAEDVNEHRFVFGDTSDCEVVHGALYWCLRALFGLSVAALLLCIFAAMLVYQLLHHERKKTYWEQLELRCRHLYPSVRDGPAGRGAPAVGAEDPVPAVVSAPDPAPPPIAPSPQTLRESSPVAPSQIPVIPPSPTANSPCGCRSEECRECAEERNCCPQPRPSPRPPHSVSHHGSHSRRTGQDARPWHAWESMDDRYWSSRVGNLYSPNPEDAVGQRDSEGAVNERGGHSQRWNWRLPWNRSMPGDTEDHGISESGGPDNDRPSHQFSPDSQYGFGGGNEPCHGMKNSQTANELRPPSPPSSSTRASASPIGRPHCPRARSANRPALVPSLSADAVALGVSALDDLHLSNMPPYTYLWGPPPPYPQPSSRLELRGLRSNSEAGRRHGHHRHPHKHLHRHHHHHHREKAPLEEEEERWQGEGTSCLREGISEEGDERDETRTTRMSMRGRREVVRDGGEWEGKRTQQRHGNVESELYFADVSSCNGGREEHQQYNSGDEDDGRGTSEDGDTGRATTTGEGSTDDGDLSSSGYYGGGGGIASSPLVPSPSEAFLRGGPMPISDSESHHRREDAFRFGHPSGHIAPDARYEPMPRRGLLRRQCAYVREEPDGDGMEEDDMPGRHSGPMCPHRRQCGWPQSHNIGRSVPENCGLVTGDGTVTERSAFRPFPRSFSEEDAVALRMASVDV
ncbi:uncharacterized protein LOC124168795 isoform X2 [Ischnura elegans]|uniref:uncharacterized protein LOC124168795 isoform X2 n=1 Tax=Ischnura elegans TaxID=197161 RepID=UPI001ED8AC23|nr:uncharacterized protein LOC124168795 isoform X2 [Ischnura elegans]